MRIIGNILVCFLCVFCLACGEENSVRKFKDTSKRQLATSENIRFFKKFFNCVGYKIGDIVSANEFPNDTKKINVFEDFLGFKTYKLSVCDFKLNKYEGKKVIIGICASENFVAPDKLIPAWTGSSNLIHVCNDEALMKIMTNKWETICSKFNIYKNYNKYIKCAPFTSLSYKLSPDEYGDLRYGTISLEIYDEELKKELNENNFKSIKELEGYVSEFYLEE